MLRELRRVMMERSTLATFLLLVMSCTEIVAAPCPANGDVDLVVNDTASANNLAEAVNCSGGVFHVDWKGSVVVERAICITDGTSVHVAGGGLGASMDGGGVTQLFTVKNATLHVSNMQLSNGYSAAGGAIASDASSVSFIQTSFSGNIAIENGGALVIGNESTVSWAGPTTFFNNTAGGEGGALFISANSNASWEAETSFSHNNASWYGGAVMIDDGSIASWEAETSFFNNTAGYSGGALFVSANSKVSWESDTSFSNNTADGYGGAVYVYDGSQVSWEAETSFTHNGAAFAGGAVILFDNSSASWEAETSFFHNSVAYFGGAVCVFDGSSVSWKAETSFSNNSAGEFGGAVFVNIDSNASWESETSFFHNTAGSHGGAVSVEYGSSAFWKGETLFSNNTASNLGGAVYVEYVSSASWEAETSFYHNTAGYYGGAVMVYDGSSASWEAETSFFRNTAGDRGGAVFVYNVSSASWAANTLFFHNYVSGSGGALYVSDGSHASWAANMSFLNNNASEDGGAVFVGLLDSVYVGRSPSVSANGPTTFLNNVCGAGGGGMAMTGTVSVNFFTENVLFSGNSAAVTGGAVSVVGVEVGPQFMGVRFVSNVAEIGGGVYVTGSGTSVTEDDDYDVQYHPTTFSRCEFIGNEAKATGGAVDSASGRDMFNEALFEGNSARVGGALRLAGTASLQNCNFTENTSDEDGGPAISNIGYISNMTNILFVDNVFTCEEGKFLDYGPSEVDFDTVCDGNEVMCDACFFEGKLPSCAEQLDHSNSPGGNATLEMLSITPGYWRATVTSENLLACYNPDACRGGITGAANFCRHGYEGPYCSVCSDDYTASLGFACNRCPDSAGGVVLLVVIFVLAMIAFASFLFHMMSREREGADRGILARVKRYIPMQSLKIVIVMWQILTQFSEVANITYPDVYQKFLDRVDILNFDLSWILSAGCIFDVDFHARLIMTTIGPLICTAILGATYLVAVRRHRGSNAALGDVRQKHLSMLLLLMFMVYSSVASTLFQMFACDELDDGNNYLRADYRIECDSSRHENLQIYTGFMIVVYTVGIPVFYTTLLFRNRHVLTDRIGRENDMRVQSTTDLWKPYKPDRYYYEVIECCRRILLAGVAVFIYPNTAAQVAVTLVMAVFFMIISEALAPYVSRRDAWMSRTGHAIVFMSMYVALLLKVDVSDEKLNSQRVFEVILVSANACMIAAVAVEVVVVAYLLRKQQREP